MKRMLFAVTALTALFAGSAIAADLSVRPSPPPVTTYNWTGCYLGGNAGAVMSDKEWYNATPGSPVFGVSFGTHSPNNLLIGLQAGCDYQAGIWVIGVQGDYDWSDARDSNRNNLTLAISDRTTTRSLATATGRLGIAWDLFLGYIKGGAAWKRDTYEQFLNGADLVTATAGESRSGWTAGFGAEVAFFPFLSGFVEASYFNFGRKVNTFTPTAGGATFPIDINDRTVVIRGGINWRFTAAPAVAKY
jgi:outer membrane immunogenic protein